MGKKGNPGINAFANSIGKIANDAANKPPNIDLGIIQGDYSLKLDSLGVPIPKGGYSVCRAVTYDPGIPLTQSYNDGAHGHPDAGYGGSHTHNIRLPEKMYWIRPGDRVLVVIVGNEAIVVDIVLSSERVG